MSPFASALYQICVEENSTTSIELIRNAALAQIANGGGVVSSLSNSSLNGKSFSVLQSVSADVLFTEAGAAIRQFNSGSYGASQIDFSGI